MKGYLKQKGIPTPDKPVPIETQVIGENLFKTYEVNGRQYTDNLPENALISISKKQYIEYEQQKENIIKEAINYIKEESWFCYKDNEEVIDRVPINKLLEILGDNDENI